MTRTKYLLRKIWLGGLVTGVAFAESTAPAPATPANTDELFELGKQLFDQLAPAEVKENYEFPSKERWDEFALRLQGALAGDSLEELAVYAPEGRAALPALRLIPGCEGYAEWFEQRLDEMEGAKQALTPAPVPVPAPTPANPPAPKQKTAPPKTPALPYYDLWVARVRERPLPARASELMPRLRAAFVAEGVPAELAWLAEAESTLNPTARNPAGAKGLFQLMPETAQSLGLDTFLPDERTDPDKSARAAARYLKALHGKFGSWPLALAAYNAGEGRVRRALAARGAKDFAGIASALPAETRMYVPKVCALVALRAGVTPDKIPPPRA
ncbi:MAG TPA: lytic transglycosylase domain-containing protein [Opitutaceae bacterium]|nr:lytic transglycosylase domain-containing protein [Opitutaceae bacterium]